MKFDEAVTRYVRWMRDEQDFREQTIYRVNKQLRYIARHAEWDQLGDVDADSLAEFLRKKRPSCVPETLKSYTDAARGLTRVAADKGWLATDPLKGFVGVRDRSGGGGGVRALSEDEVRRLIVAASRVEKGRARYADRKRVRVAYYKALWYTGVRRKASKAMRWGDIDFDTSTIVVRPEANKARRGQRIVLHPALADALRDIQPPDATPADLVFDRLPSMQTLKLDCAVAGITGRVGWHSFRKGMASRLAANNVPTAIIAKQTGHASLDVLSRAYVDADLGGLVDAIGNLSDVSCESQKKTPVGVDPEPNTSHVTEADAPVKSMADGDAGVTQWSSLSIPTDSEPEKADRRDTRETSASVEVPDGRTDATIQLLDAVIRLLRGG